MHCDGCDDPTPPVQPYEIRTEAAPTTWEPVRYCRECSIHAEHSAACNRDGLSFNGQSETLEIRDGQRRAGR
jgi:hypothetical protein